MVPLWVRTYAICGTGLWCHIMCCAFLGGQICKSWIWVELSTPAQETNLPFEVVFFSCCYNEFCVDNVRTNRLTCQDRQHGKMEPVEMPHLDVWFHTVWTYTHSCAGKWPTFVASLTVECGLWVGGGGLLLSQPQEEPFRLRCLTHCLRADWKVDNESGHQI